VACEAVLVSRVLWRAAAERDRSDKAPVDDSQYLVPTAEDVDSMHRWTGGGGGRGDAQPCTAVAYDDADDAEEVAAAGETARLMARLSLRPYGEPHGALRPEVTTTTATTAADAAAAADADDAVAAAAVAAARRNNFAIMDPLLVPVAAACCPLGALLNHSCAPNCVVSYRLQPLSGGGGGGEGGPGEWIQEFRCVREVSAGEELCHAYVDASSPPGERAKELRARYGFTCACPRCPPAPPPPPRAVEAALREARALLDEAAAEEDLEVERSKAEAAVAILLAAEAEEEANKNKNKVDEAAETVAAETEEANGTRIATAAAPGPSPLLTWRLRGGALHVDSP
jgi:hypothetical protein